MPRKIVDCFTFYNETPLLLARLGYLYDTVDYFVIAECVRTTITWSNRYI